jgi:hypothetical protein
MIRVQILQRTAERRPLLFCGSCIVFSYNIDNFQREARVKKLIVASSSLFFLVLMACSRSIPPTIIPISNTAGPSLTATQVPNNTASALTPTPDIVTELMPEGQPTSEWKGVPIMPDAIAGEGDEESYVYTVKATPQQVQEYYQFELGKLGWQLLDAGNKDSSLMLMFMDKTSTTLTISVIAKGNEALVLLVK